MIAAWLSAIAVAMLLHPPAKAGPMMIHTLLCGSGGAMDIPVGSRHGRSDRQDTPCTSACHAGNLERKRPGKPKI
jgi:hypothetical protein